MKYFQVIITFPNGNAPKVYLIPYTTVDQKMHERMEKELEEFPYWCSPCCEESICDIDKIGTRIDVNGKLHTDCNTGYIVVRTFWYCVE